MKRYILIILSLGLSLLLTGCSKEYLDTTLKSSLGEDQFSTNHEYIEQLLNGTHSYIYSHRMNQGYQGVQNLHIIFDLLGEDLIYFSTIYKLWHTNEMRWRSHISETGSLSEFPWRIFYRVIFNCNEGISAIEQYKEEDPAAYNRIRGEFLALRAYSHFMLVQLYGKHYDISSADGDLGVIIRTEPGVNYEPAPRNTVAEVYRQINTDIEAAIASLQESSSSKKNYIRLGTAYGLQARIALVQGRWEDAVEAADQAIGQSSATLQSGEELRDGFNNSEASEWMWAYTQAEDQNAYFGSYFAYMSWNFSSSIIRSVPKVINKDLYETMGANDVRRKWWDPAGKSHAKKFKGIPYMTKKYTATPEGTSNGDRLFMRLAEMYYIKAEAQARSGNDADAAQTLYEIMTTRDPDYTLSASTGDALIEEIMNNRRIELWGEGFRFMDLKRLNQKLDRNLASNTDALCAETMEIEAGDNRWQFKIPAKEINANPLCVQNP